MAQIMLLDDNADMLQALAEVLEINDHNVIPITNPEEGLSMLFESPHLPDLIISDLTMPRMDGLEFLGHVRQTPHLSHIPVAIMSGRVTDSDDAFAAGANAFLNKPFKFHELESVLSTLVR